MNNEKDLTVEQTFNLAVKNHQNSNFQDAQNYYQKVLKIDPNHSTALNNLGAIYQNIKEHRKAKDCYEKAIEINPNYVSAHNNLGVIFKELEENQKAKECFEKVIEINSNYNEAHNNLGNVFKDLGNLQEAEECYKKAIELKPDYKDAHDNLDYLSKEKRLLTKIGKVKNSNNKTKIISFKKNTTKSFLSNLRLTSNPFISNRKVEAELISQLYKINSEKLDDAMPKHLHYGNGKTSDYNLFENDFSTIKNVEKDLINVMKEAVKSDIFIIESFFNIFQKGSGVVPHNHLTNLDYNFGLLNQKYSLTYYLDIGDQNCSEPGVLKLQDPNKEILPSEGMILIFPASRKHSATYNGRKDRVMIGINFYSFI